MLHYWGMMAGYGDFAMRIPSLLFILASLIVIWKLIPLLRPGIGHHDALVAFTVCAFAPVVWIQASTARYYALATLAGLYTTYAYLRWVQSPTAGRSVAWTLSLVATFYLHYLLALLAIGAQTSHFLCTWGSRKTPLGRKWLIAMIITISLALPMVLTSAIPVLAGKQTGLSNRAAEGITGMPSFPLMLAGEVFTTLTGAIPFPWHVWVTGPLFAAAAGLVFADLRRNRLLWSPPFLFLAVIPLVLVALIIALILPVAGYFHGILRVPHIAVMMWIALGLIAAGISHTALRQTVVGIILVCNAYLLILNGLDFFSMNQSTPLKAVAHHIARSRSDPTCTIVAHPFWHGWGDPLSRYLNGIPTLFLADDCAEPPIATKEASIRNRNARTVWIVQRNRFRTSAETMSSWLVAQGFELCEEVPLQEQSAFDRWFKERLQQCPLLHLSKNASSKSYWTIKRYDRTR